jgi:ribosomal protein L10
MTAMRKKARETGVYLKVVKNTLAARAVEGTDYSQCVKDSTHSVRCCMRSRPKSPALPVA